MSRENERNYRVNQQIRVSPVVVINPDGHNMGSMPTQKALDIAFQSGLDLVEIAPNSRPPVCRVMDFGKFKFEQNLKEKKQRRRQKQTQVKEIRLSPSIQEHDVETKLKAAIKFLEAGHRVVVKLEFRRRELAHRDIGDVVMQRFLESLKPHGSPISKPKSEGRSLNCMVEPANAEDLSSNTNKKGN